MKVLFHTRTADNFDWEKQVIEMHRLPSEGEYIAIEKGQDEEWHRVRLVCHVAVGREYEAGIYCNRLGPRVADRLPWTSTTEPDEPRGPLTVMLTLEQAAQATGVSTKTLCRLIDAGRLQATDYGTGKHAVWRIAPQWLESVRPQESAPTTAVAPRRGRRSRAAPSARQFLPPA